MILFETLGVVAGAIFVFVTVLFFLSLLVKRNDIADSAWGVGVFLVGVVPALLYGASGVALLVLIVAGIWAARLSLRIILRNRKKTEDARYRVWRESWGRWFYLRSYGQIYLLQGSLMIAVGYVLLHAVVYGSTMQIGPMALLGLAVWLVGFWFEAVGDYQLDRYLALPMKPSSVMQQGLWKYTRHPNYFGEVTMWWGVWLMVLPTDFGYWAVISPLVITFLILKVSGIPMLEKHFADNPEFADYKRRTSAFFPWPPRL